MVKRRIRRNVISYLLSLLLLLFDNFVDNKYRYPGVIIPSLPEKQIMGNFEQSFIESRKRGLQKFLNRVAMHPLLIEARQFVKFLTANEDAFSMERLATEQKKQNVLKDTFVSW